MSPVKKYRIASGLSFFVALIGTGIQYRWPEQKWIGTGLIALGGLGLIIFLVAWFVRAQTIKEFERVHPSINAGTTLPDQQLTQVANPHNQNTFTPTQIFNIGGQSQSQTQTQNQKQEQKQTAKKDVGRPNLVDRGVRAFRAHQNLWTQVLVEGASDTRYSFDPDWQVLTIEVCNEFRVTPKTTPIENLTAEITYSFPDSSKAKLNRGAWLDLGNRIGLGVNDYGQLIIVGALMRTPLKPHIFIREYPIISRNDSINLERIMFELPYNEDYPLEINLISEDRGEHYATFNYILAIDGEGYVELVETSDWDAFREQRAKAKTQQGDA
jgi:hypothetical protein